MNEQPAPPPTALRVVRGRPSHDELAALVVVLSAANSGDDVRPPVPSLWATSGRARSPLAAGRGAWRASALPH